MVSILWGVVLLILLWFVPWVLDRPFWKYTKREKYSDPRVVDARRRVKKPNHHKRKSKGGNV